MLDERQTRVLGIVQQYAAWVRQCLESGWDVHVNILQPARPTPGLVLRPNDLKATGVTVMQIVVVAPESVLQPPSTGVREGMLA